MPNGYVPLKPGVPFPATVVITPFETLRMQHPLSAMYRLPVESTATPVGLSNWALVAGPLSPLKPAVPFPATVVIIPFATLRIRLLSSSAMYRLPAESKAIPWGDNLALIAGPLSPKEDPPPATVLIVPFEISRMRPLSAMYKLLAESTARPNCRPFN